MNSENSLLTKIRSHALAKFGEHFNASITALQIIEQPSRFDGPVYLAVISLTPLEEDVLSSLAQCDPDDIEQMRKRLAKGHEIACVFDSAGEELERHFRGGDYFFDYQKIEI